MNRRTFLKLVGMSSISIAAGCTPDPYEASRPDKTLFSLVHAPDDMVTGDASWYAATCRECPAGCGILAKNREGRVIKVEGNPLHPINRGTLCMRGQASVQGIHNPDRIQTPLLKEDGRWRPITFAEAGRILRIRTEKAAKTGPNRVRMITEVVGESLFKLFEEALMQWGAGGPLVFEPFAYESLKAANDSVYGIKGLPSYHMEQADLLVTFGADFLETWLSPVEYARKFKMMHALQGNSKGLSYHIGPCQSLTAANADFWLASRPGSEAYLALGLIREILQSGRAGDLPAQLRSELENAAAPYSPDRAVDTSGVPLQLYEHLVESIVRSKRPLILGTGIAASGPNALSIDLAVNYLNLLLDPDLSLLDFAQRHRVEMAASRSDVLRFFQACNQEPVDVLLLNNVNPIFSLPTATEIETVLTNEALYVISFSNFMDETTSLADLVLPVCLPLEVWDEYSGKQGLVSTLQPAMGSYADRTPIGDVFLNAAFGKKGDGNNFKAYLIAGLLSKGLISDERGWLQTLRSGGIFEGMIGRKTTNSPSLPSSVDKRLTESITEPAAAGLTLIASPSIRFFDGRGANRPWLCEVPDPITRVAWQTPLLAHPDTLAEESLKHGEHVKVTGKWGEVEVPLYEAPGVRPGVLAIGIGQGHTVFGRYAAGKGANPMQMLPYEPVDDTGIPDFSAWDVQIKKSGRTVKLAHTDGSRIQHDRKIALAVKFSDLADLKKPTKAGLAMWDFPLTLPLPEGYDPKRDFYPPHEHAGYRWAMAVDLDRCIGCGACAAACYAENNIGIVYEKRILEGREMAWLSVERYKDEVAPERITFLPLMCQHCDNAPCESVCPVYAPHHNKEGMNNQIYNRCIGTRFCSQNCPYKVRRFNWFTWEWPHPIERQLNPNVTVRSKGVMEKCSFCVQRIKEAHGWAKNEKREIRDGEVIPACVQTCPTGALTFGSLMDQNSRVRQLTADPRAYQIMGYLNTKPAVIYLKKVVYDV